MGAVRFRGQRVEGFMGGHNFGALGFVGYGGVLGRVEGIEIWGGTE